MKINMLALCALLLCACGAKPQRDAARQLPWPAIDISAAQAHIDIDEKERLLIRIQHQPLRDITPEMVRWFYQQLPVSEVEYKGQQLPWYHIFHPSEHGQIHVQSAAPDGMAGMARGAVIYRYEWFGNFDSEGQGLVTHMDASGMTVIARVAGITVAEIRHQFIGHHWGTEYRLSSRLGTEWPWLNRWLIAHQFPPAMVQQWVRHQQEEVASLNYFLPALYQQRHTGHYHLAATPR